MAIWRRLFTVHIVFVLNIFKFDLVSMLKWKEVYWLSLLMVDASIRLKNCVLTLCCLSVDDGNGVWPCLITANDLFPFIQLNKSFQTVFAREIGSSDPSAHISFLLINTSGTTLLPKLQTSQSFSYRSPRIHILFISKHFSLQPLNLNVDPIPCVHISNNLHF